MNSCPDSLPNLNYILGCRGNCVKITILEEEKLQIRHKKNVRFHIFEYISKKLNYGIRPIKDCKTCSK